MGMMVWMALFWAALIGGGIWLIASMSQGSRHDSAEEVLRERLARGDIDTDEFNRRMAAIDGTALRARRLSWRVAAVGLLLALFILVPLAVMSANGWDMWDMHHGGRNTSNDPVIVGGLEVIVRIEDFAFRPGNLEVPAGARVTWTNEDSAPHDATARSRDWKTERLSRGESDARTFDSAREYDYYCSIHPNMKARLVVR